VRSAQILRLDDPAHAARWCAEARAAGRRLGFVPTMGALHAGHLALVAAAREECDVVAASVFVNPLQFDDPRDLERYPRDFERDAALLGPAGCGMVFTGTLASFFPGTGGARERIAWRDPGPAAAGLEGARRPGHFAGVATIVARLFELVRPDVACFGEKDFQQTLVVRDLARALGGPRIRVCPTVREPSGLALSSRNARLSAAARAQAAGIWRALLVARAAWRERGLRSRAALGAALDGALRAGGLEVEYAEVRDPERWSEPGDGPLARARAFAAVRLEGVRLIDTLALDAGGDLP
jgi:pantoate--beta-alanine ligase